MLAVHRDLSRVDGIVVAEFGSSLREEFGQHSTLAPRSTKQEGREARPVINSAGHASGGSLLLLPWLGPIGAREGSGEMDGRCWPLAI